MTTELVPNELNGADLFKKNQLDSVLEQIRTNALSVVPNIKTAKGRKEIASLAAKVARSKTLIDGLGKTLVADAKKSIKQVDNQRKHARETLDALKKEVRKPLDDWEAAEEERKERIRADINHLKEYAKDCGDLPATMLENLIEALENTVIDESFQEFQQEAEGARAISLARLRDALVSRRKFEADQAELQALREKQEAWDRREAKEREEAEAKAEEERKAEEAAEIERKAQERAQEIVEENREQAIIDEPEQGTGSVDWDALRKTPMTMDVGDYQQVIESQPVTNTGSNAIDPHNKPLPVDILRTPDSIGYQEYYFNFGVSGTEQERQIAKDIIYSFIKSGFSEETAYKAYQLIITGQIPHVRIY